MFEQIKLPYAFDALEPHIDKLTMETHYMKHHAAYTKNLNDAAEKAGLSNKPIEALLSNFKTAVPDEVKTAVRNNGGGFFNHNLYFGHLAPGGGGEPSGALADGIRSAFGGFSDFKEQISKAAMGQFGSGWAWLAADGSGALRVMASPNQDNPLMDVAAKRGQPILGLDVWEHAYYLKYQNRRPEYVGNFWNVVNWKKVAELYKEAVK